MFLCTSFKRYDMTIIEILSYRLALKEDAFRK